MVSMVTMKLLLWENLIHNIYHIPHWFYHFFIFITMRKRNWPDRKNRKCPSCSKMLTYTRKDSFDRAVGNNSVCKSCLSRQKDYFRDNRKNEKSQRLLNIRKKYPMVYKSGGIQRER